MASTSKAVARLKTAAQVSKELMLEAAILATKDGLSQHAVAKQIGVPRSTMRDRMVNPEPKAKGAPTKLPEWAEKELVDLLVSCADMGVPLNRFHSLQVISEMAAELGMENLSFGDKYFRHFTSRHKDLSLRITHASNRKKDREWMEAKCEEYIRNLQALKDQGFLETLGQVWNLDEAAFGTVRMYDRVIARKGVRQIAS
ncbi:hypothetical protein RvY_16088 [Ramazzottius varieornatus]|uniref:HTH psq-type domain-containing protein n=1 Tax=Ramazzottius varieornatus TaxID=947166 RepID=A0A1D1W506_RAMVA|nr:hypothetical protein RvY_16088 [Ramazzottius varieornatus]